MLISNIGCAYFLFEPSWWNLNLFRCRLQLLPTLVHSHCFGVTCPEDWIIRWFFPRSLAFASYLQGAFSERYTKDICLRHCCRWIKCYLNSILSPSVFCYWNSDCHQKNTPVFNRMSCHSVSIRMIPRLTSVLSAETAFVDWASSISRSLPSLLSKHSAYCQGDMQGIQCALLSLPNCKHSISPTSSDTFFQVLCEKKTVHDGHHIQ